MIGREPEGGLYVDEVRGMRGEEGLQEGFILASDAVPVWDGGLAGGLGVV